MLSYCLQNALVAMLETLCSEEARSGRTGGRIYDASLRANAPPCAVRAAAERRRRSDDEQTEQQPGLEIELELQRPARAPVGPHVADGRTGASAAARRLLERPDIRATFDRVLAAVLRVHVQPDARSRDSSIHAPAREEALRARGLRMNVAHTTFIKQQPTPQSAPATVSPPRRSCRVVC